MPWIVHAARQAALHKGFLGPFRVLQVKAAPGMPDWPGPYALAQLLLERS